VGRAGFFFQAVMMECTHKELPHVHGFVLVSELLERHSLQNSLTKGQTR
jgi:hypothetical protein